MQEMLQDIDESYLNLWERLRLARIRSKNEGMLDVHLIGSSP